MAQVVLCRCTVEIVAEHPERISFVFTWRHEVVREKLHLAMQRFEGNIFKIPLLPWQRDAVTKTASRHAVGHEPVNLFAISAARPIRDPRKSAVLQAHSVAVVTGEYFVPRISRQRHGHMLPGQARNVISRQRRGIAKGLFQRAADRFYRTHDIWLKDQLMVFSAEFLRD